MSAEEIIRNILRICIIMYAILTVTEIEKERGKGGDGREGIVGGRHYMIIFYA